jgi:hypothetical protein
MRSYAAAFALFTAASAAFVLAGRGPVEPETEPPAELFEATPESVAVLKRIVAKAQLYGRLAGGEVTLAEAVRQYLALDRVPPTIPEDRYDYFPGRSLGERIADRIVATVDSRMTDNPRRQQVLDALACEQAALVAGASGEWAPDRP